MAEFKEADSVAKFWFIFSMLWFPALTTFGLILAIKFFNPTFLVAEPWQTFGRIRPSHVNGVVFGFLSSGQIGAMFYIIPRLVNRPLHRPNIAKFTAVLWNVGVLVGILMILGGDTQAREMAELPWVIDVGIMIALILMGYVVLTTIMKRKEHKLYVSLWFFASIALWFPIVYFVGNVMWNPPTGALYGLTDAIFNWFYGHNVLGLWFTPFGLALWYYFIPKLINRPLYSHTLSIISFFALGFFYTGVGAHHILQSPIPEWLKTLAIVNSGLMMFSVLTFGANIGMTLRGYWHNIFSNVPLRFIVFGFICYILVSMQGSFQALRDVNEYTHFSQWTIGHSHLSLLGSFGILLMGAMFWLVPRMTGKKLFSDFLMSLSWWIAFGGFIFFMFGMELAGLVANAGWWQHMTIAQVLPTLEPYFIVRAIGGGAVVVAAYIFAVNIILTLISKPIPTVKTQVE